MDQTAATIPDYSKATGVPRGAIVLGGSYGSLAVARSLGRSGIGVAHVVEKSTVAQHSRHVVHTVVWKGPGDPEALSFLIGMAEKLALTGWVLLPSGDAEVQFVTRNYAILSTRFNLVTMPWSELESLNDKAQLYRLADRLGIGYPKTYADGIGTLTPPEAIRFPVVIKPSSTEKSNALTRAKAWKVETLDDYREKYALAASFMGETGFVVQELIPGDGATQFSYAGLWRHGHELFGLTARRSRQFPEFGTSPFVETIDMPRVRDEARKLLMAVKYHGLVEVEFKLDSRDDQLKVLDVNTRIWAWIGLGVETGLDFPMLAVNLALGASPQANGPVRYGARWRRLIPTLLSLVTSVMKTGHLGYAGWRSLFGPSTAAVFAGDDPVPALVEIPVQVWRKLSGLARR